MAFQHKIIKFGVCRSMGRRNLSTADANASHVAALLDQARDATEEWAARSGLVEMEIGGGQTLIDHVHDLRNNVADLRVLTSKD